MWKNLYRASLMYHFALLCIQDIFMLTPVFKPVHDTHT